MTEKFAHNSDPTQSARNGYLVVPSDVDLPQVPRELLILEDGELEFIWSGYRDDAPPTEVQIITVTAGERLPWAVRRITEGTTASVYAVY